VCFLLLEGVYTLSESQLCVIIDEKETLSHRLWSVERGPKPKFSVPFKSQAILKKKIGEKDVFLELQLAVDLELTVLVLFPV